MIKPALSNGNLKVIASTTWDEYRKHFEKDPALVRRFQRVTVDEPSQDVTLQILKGIKKYYEAHHNTKIKDDALHSAIKLSVKYQADKKLPDKAIDLIDCACSRFNLKFDGNRIVGEREIQYELAKMIQMPEEQIMESESSNLSNLDNNLKTAIFGQESAIDELVDKILVAQAGLKPENKPIGSFMLVGKSGCGKSALSIELAKHLGVNLIRFDMSEFQEAHSVSKLIGSPPGYVGFEENAGMLITKIQEHPNAVLLLDEIEKAHPSVATIMLQIMDNGFITGSNGKRADCRNLIILMTSNAGASETERNQIGFGSQVKEWTDTELKKHFTPEFRNRLDGVVLFNSLTKEIMVNIVNKQLDELRSLVRDKGIKIKVDKAATTWLANQGYDPSMGARPLARLIDRDIKRPLSKLMLFSELRSGGTLSIGVADDKLVLTHKTKLSKSPMPIADTVEDLVM
jgi:ATP-dependent Clp protease ATP-binding subunit ClpA